MGRRISLPPACKRCGLFKELRAEGYCAKCLPHAPWIMAIKQANDEDQVRINHVLYRIRPEVKPDRRYPVEATGGRGFGGRTFVIEFKDGRVVTTRDLWYLGDIPEEYWEALPDNAAFGEGGARA